MVEYRYEPAGVPRLQSANTPRAGLARSGADPWKLHRQMAEYGNSTEGMPPLEVSRGTDGELMINNGVTRDCASRNCRRERLFVSK